LTVDVFERYKKAFLKLFNTMEDKLRLGRKETNSDPWFIFSQLVLFNFNTLLLKSFLVTWIKGFEEITDVDKNRKDYRHKNDGPEANCTASTDWMIIKEALLVK